MPKATCIFVAFFEIQMRRTLKPFKSVLFSTQFWHISMCAQSWTALFRAFSSHQQPSASRTKLLPSCCGFFITNLRQTKRTQHFTIVFYVNQF